MSAVKYEQVTHQLSGRLVGTFVLFSFLGEQGQNSSNARMRISRSIFFSSSSDVACLYGVRSVPSI